MGTIWEQMTIFAVFNPEIHLKLMKVTAFIRKTAKKNDLDSKATIYFRLRDGKKDIKAALQVNFPSVLIIGARKSRAIKTAWLWCRKTRRWT